MIRRIFIIVCLFAAVSCNREPVSQIPDGMNLVWADEFTVDGAPDKDKWDYCLGGDSQWGYGEVQDYTNERGNSFVKGGKLHLVAYNDDGLWKSARLKTQYKADWTYGYVEVRAKLPRGVGTWPAIWMLPTFAKYGIWPRSGEIDIMEHVGYDLDKIFTTVHTEAYNHTINTQKGTTNIVKDVTKKYHTYAVEWTAEYIQWYVDGKALFRHENEHLTTAEWPFDIPYYLIMNIAIGGILGGKEGIDPKMKQAEMIVDYVRVYQ